MSPTTGPSPACSVCTCVSATLNGPSTVTEGAAVSVDPMTATLPVVPGSVHSGAPPGWGAAAGQALAGSVTDDVTTSATDGELDDVVSASEPHAASATTSDAAQEASATDEDRREDFTVATVQPPFAAPDAGRYRDEYAGLVLDWWSTHGEQ